MNLSFLCNSTILMSILAFYVPIVGYCVEAEKFITCPMEIVCSRDKSVSSCKAIGNNLEYWSVPLAGSTVKKGTYLFKGIYSPYQAPDVNFVYSRCSYELYDQETNTNAYLSLLAKNYFFEAYLGVTNKWTIADGYSAHCEDTKSELCPLAMIPVIKIKNNAIGASLDIYANGILVNENPMYFSDEPHTITQYKAWDGCSDSGLCLFHLMITEGAGTSEIGSVLVDMSNKMKVEFVYPNCGIGYSISSKPETPNLIEITKSSL